MQRVQRIMSIFTILVLQFHHQQDILIPFTGGNAMRQNHVLYFIAIALLGLSTLSCLTSPKDDSSDFSNKLDFGTSLDNTGMNLADAGTTFTMFGSSIMLWVRIETEFDQAGTNAVVNLQRKDAGGTVLWDTTMTIVPAQNYGHILLHSFYLSSRGNYSANASFAFSPIKAAGTKNFVVQ
jgi:hypothetical protein